ncbi:hypothetical protein GUJ93_ZPchr0006g45896 [Zizania palustris]|uniref:Uncharacterized protein n=1 Tax=Zizania palustris TaxID=103762 RepID=A0A8J5T9M1_ZIZPA|nr:hypothetical protein GUJ93_ZPchr0006g45896 [Zizania palustris]
MVETSTDLAQALTLGGGPSSQEYSPRMLTGREETIQGEATVLNAEQGTPLPSALGAKSDSFAALSLCKDERENPRLGDSFRCLRLNFSSGNESSAEGFLLQRIHVLIFQTRSVSSNFLEWFRRRYPGRLRSYLGAEQSSFQHLV